MMVRMMSTRPAMMILPSKTPVCLPPDSWMALAASPIIVLRPVSVTSGSYAPGPGRPRGSLGNATYSRAVVDAHAAIRLANELLRLHWPSLAVGRGSSRAYA